jgi:hypothetical protein
MKRPFITGKTVILVLIGFGIGWIAGPGGVYTKPNNSYGIEYNRFKADSVIHVPRRAYLGPATSDTTPQIFYFGESLYEWRNGAASPFGTNGIDTSHLSDRIDGKLWIADTTLMLDPYLRENVAAATYYPQTNPSGYITNNGLPNVQNSLQVVNAGGATSVQSGGFMVRPVAGIPNRFYFATDSLKWYFDNGTTWQEAKAGANVPSLNGPYITASDANFVGLYSPATYRLPSITNDRTFAPPGGTLGDILKIWVENNNAHHWKPTAFLKDAAGNGLSIFTNASYYTFQFNGSNWIKMN